MKKRIKSLSTISVVFFALSISVIGIAPAQAEEIDVSYLQTCLKEEGSSLDVLVLMDASASLRDARPDDPWYKQPDRRKGSDPEKLRGKILKSSLKLLRTLADDSQRTFNINLRTFGNNTDPEKLRKLEEHSIDWTSKTSDGDLQNFVEQALYDDSDETDWTSALASAKNQLKQRIGQAALAKNKSCPVMFWITDGAPTTPTGPICTSNTDASIDWFRQNNVLVLGGLLQPRIEEQRRQANEFRRIVIGENCGSNQPGWTRGEVIEAKDIGDLAWGFVGLVASIKNLINLNGENSGFYVDPGTSHIEIYIRGNQQSWQINGPNGTKICSSTDPGKNCQISSDSEVGITTVTIYPDDPTKASGNWKITPSFENEYYKVYGSLNTSSRDQKLQPRLSITSAALNSDIEEGVTANFQVKIINPDGSDFSISGYKNVNICAKVASAETSTCKSGSGNAQLSVTPIESDKSVSFEAILTSSYDSKRNYRIAASESIRVIPSGAFPSLVCDSKNCKFENLKNKMAKSVNTLRVEPAKKNPEQGRITLVGFTILSDNNKNRGDGHFIFKAQRSNGEILNWPSQNQFLLPGEKIQLTISTDLAGDSEIQGIIKYKVYSEGKEVIRQQNFNFNVKHDSNLLTQILLLLLTYLITIGIPYLYLLWAAKRAAVLNVPDGEFSYLVLPFEISEEGKVSQSGETLNNATFAPDYKNLVKKTLEPEDGSVQIDKVQVEVIPPKWNPFSATKTEVKLGGNYLVSTFGNQSVNFEKSPFVSSLINEVILYFSADGNINASHSSQEELVESDNGLDFLESSYESKLTEVTSAPTGPVTGSAIFLVSPYLNREKSLAELVLKLNTSMATVNFSEKINELRESSLQQLIAQREAEKLKAEQEKSKKLGKKQNRAEEIVDEVVQSSETSIDDEWGGSTNSSSKPRNFPESGKNTDSW